MPDVLIDHESAADLIVEQAETLETIVTEALQGPPGIQGIPGPAGGATTIIVGPSPLSGHTAVAVNSAGLLVYADCTDAAQLGLTLGVQALADDLILADGGAAWGEWVDAGSNAAPLTTILVVAAPPRPTNCCVKEGRHRS